MADLLERAKSEAPKGVRQPNEDRLRLALAVLSGDISLRQAARAMDVSETNVGARLWAQIWRASLRGEITFRRARKVTA